MDGFAVGTFVVGWLRERTRGADGWPWAWDAGAYTLHSGGHIYVEETVLFDRDRCDEATASGLARALETDFAAQHPDAHRLRVRSEPTTRMTQVLAAVTEHVADCAARDRDRMQRHDLMIGAVEPVICWRPGDDRLRVEIYANSSADEGAAQRLGEEWLALLYRDAPHLADVVVVVGSSH